MRQDQRNSTIYEQLLKANIQYFISFRCESNLSCNSRPFFSGIHRASSVLLFCIISAFSLPCYSTYIYHRHRTISTSLA